MVLCILIWILILVLKNHREPQAALPHMITCFRTGDIPVDEIDQYLWMPRLWFARWIHEGQCWL